MSGAKDGHAGAHDPAHDTRRSGAFAAWRRLYAGAGLAFACIGLVPTQVLAEWFTHEARRAAAGGVPPTTLQGAQLLRIGAPMAGLAFAALCLWGDRIWRGRPQLPGPPAVARRELHLVLLACLLALLVRVPLMTQSLWYDEIAAYLGYGVHGPGVAVGNYYTQANHVFQSLLTSVVTGVLGANEFTLRLPSLVIGLVGIVAAWFLGREAAGPRTGIAMAFVTALMPIAALESAEARGYAFMAYYATLATATLLWAKRTRGGVAWAEYALVVALGCWSHLVTACVPACHALWLLWLAARGGEAQRRDAGGGLLALGVAGLLVLAMYAPVLPDMASIRREFLAADGNEPTLWSPEGLLMLWMLGGTWTWWASAAALPLVAAGVAAAWREPGLRRALLLSAGGAVVALAFPLVLHSWLYARFLVFLLPAVALAIGAGCVWLAARRRGAATLLAGVAALAWTGSLAVLPPRQPLREAIAHVAQMRAPGEEAIAIGLPDDVHAWYSTIYGLDMPGSGPYGRDLEARLRERHPKWAVMLYPRAMPPEVEARLRAAGFEPDLTLPGWIDSGGGEVVVWRRR